MTPPTANLAATDPAVAEALVLRIPPSQATRRVLLGLGIVLHREGSASIREIGAACGLTSTSSVAYQLTKLVASGHVEKPVRNRPRGWKLTPFGQSAVNTLAASLRTASGRANWASRVRR